MIDRRAEDPLRILWLATKSPWPPIDGGRLVMALTIAELAKLGHHITVIAPAFDQALDPDIQSVELHLTGGGPKPMPLAALQALLTGEPTTIIRHRHPLVRRKAASLIDRSGFDLVHVEQPQALSAVPGGKRPPTVLRVQNVESDLWAQQAKHSTGLRAFWLDRESKALARFEARAARSADLVIALTAADQHRFEQLSPKTATLRLAAPFPATLDSAPQELDGAPPLVVLGDIRWRPNLDALEFFFESIWPALEERFPESRLHLFGTDILPAGMKGSARVIFHPELRDSRVAFASNSILLVPLRIASGIRMKILEAWARGVPVIATTIAASGLGASHREQLLIADDVTSTLDAIDWLSSPDQRSAMIARARTFLKQHYSPEHIVSELEGAYRSVLS